MIFDLSQRRREHEWMDDPNADPAELERSLRFIRRINAWLGYTRATLGHLRDYARDWKAGEVVRILDVATGSADVPLATCRWASSQSHTVHITGIDLHERTCQLARQAVAAAGESERIDIVQGDATRLPFADGSFDYAMTNMFLHHLDEPQVIAVLQEMSRVARRGIIVADLVRRRRALFWITLFTLTAGPMVRHDARVSVRQAFTEQEIKSLCQKAGLPNLKYVRHFGHRFVLAGSR
jgi:SAM-dependent methyltransferase